MKLNKKVIESMTVTSAMLVMTTITAFGGSTEDSTGDRTKSIALNKNGTAGVVYELYEKEAEAFRRSATSRSVTVSKESKVTPLTDLWTPAEESSVSTETAVDLQEGIVLEETEEPITASEFANGAADIDDFAAETVVKSLQAEEVTEEVIAAAEETVSVETPEIAAEAPEAEAQPEIPQEEAEPEAGEWSNRVMADVEEEMNIRTAPDENAELAGKFYRGDVAEVVSIDAEWTQIVSGNVTGYVKNDYLVYGAEAGELANEVCSLYATVNTDGLRLRSEPSEEAEIVTTANTGEKLKVDKEAEALDGWVAVHTSNDTAYVSADYVGVELNLGSALSVEEAAAKEAEKAKAAGTTNKPAVAASVDEVTLLGALIQCEAGSGSYEGMVAVGAVVMNRVRSGAYPSSISGVIYQSGQFTPALNGSVANVLASGVRGACLQAAQEAIGGVDNTNGAVSFRSASSGYAGTVIGANVFF